MALKYLNNSSQQEGIQSFLKLLIQRYENYIPLEDILGELVEYFDADNTFILDIDDDNKFMHITYRYIKRGTRDDLFKVSEFPFEPFFPWIKLFKKDMSMYIFCDEKYERAEPFMYNFFKSEGIDSVMVAPLAVNGYITGFLCIINPRICTDHLLFLSVAGSSLNKEMLAEKTNKKFAEERKLLEDSLENERKLNDELNAQLDIIGGLSDIYFACYNANLKDGTYTKVKEFEFMKPFLAGVDSIDKAFELFIPSCVQEEHWKLMKDFSNYRTVAQRLKNKNSTSLEFHGKIIPWEWCQANWIATTRDKNGEVTNALFAVELIDEKVKERMIQQNKLEEALKEAKTANEAKTAFLSRMSHDIRTPLNGILGLIEIGEKRPNDLKFAEESRQKAKTAAKHLLSLISDVLDLSKLNENKIVLAHEPFDIREVCKELQTLIEIRGEENGIGFHYVYDKNSFAHPYVYGSQLHLRQILLNILDNSVKYNNAGGNVICTFETIDYNPLKNQETFRLTIEDDGIGMSEEFLKHIFEPFSQEKVDARSVYKGTGLGMAIVKELIEKMNGSITVTSKEGQGSKFVIILPFDIATEQEVVPPKKEEESINIKKMHLLLVEDNELNMEIAKTLLEEYGCVITEAHNGQEAVDAFNNNPKGTFDAILMDLMMPIMDGLTATRTIRKLPREDAITIPIVAMTANAFVEDKQKCKEAGMDDFVAKPINIESLIKKLNKIKNK